MTRKHGQRDNLPTPQSVREDMVWVVEQLVDLLHRYDEAYDASLSRPGRGMVETSGRGWSGFEDKDPTGEVAIVSWDPQHIRSGVRYAAKALRRASVEIENAIVRLQDVTLDTDPDWKIDRLDKRRAALADRDG